VIDKNPQRQPKNLFTDRKGGAKIYLYEAYNETEEGEYLAQKVETMCRIDRLNYRDFAVMYRTNAQSRAIEEAFIRQKVPYKLIGGVGFYKRQEIRDLLAYLRLVHNPDDTVSFNRVINTPKRGIGKKSLATFQMWAGQTHRTYGQAFEALSQGESSPLSGRALTSLIEFAGFLRGWQQLAATGSLVDLFDRIMADTRYRLHLPTISDTKDQLIEREENLSELRGRLAQAEADSSTLADFLTETALVADVDSLDENADAVTLLTLHSAKGLEFPIVMIAGLEDGLLPHLRSLDDPEGIAEERRLLYVGLTRAKDQVYLTYAFRRYLYGGSDTNLPSRFLADLPANLIEGLYSSGSASRRDSLSYQRETTWDQAGFSAPRAKIIPFPGASAAKLPPKPELPPTQFKPRMRVHHPKFGEGVVLESQRTPDDEEVTVVFPVHGVKRLAASFARLTVLD
jgi:DNA helicase-2/ATP-dependent DNA helicase PcrA